MSLKIMRIYYSYIMNDKQNNIEDILYQFFKIWWVLASVEELGGKKLCESCVLGKGHCKPFGTRLKTKKPGELIHTDVSRFIIGLPLFCFIQRWSFRFVYFSQFYKTNIKEIVSDNGGEFDNHEITQILKRKGIGQRFTIYVWKC